MRAGSRWIYRETDGRGKEPAGEVTVTSGTKQIARDSGSGDPRVASERRPAGRGHYDWVAQDSEGNVWYPGRGHQGDTRTARSPRRRAHGRPASTGAQAGVIVPAKPRVGMTYAGRTTRVRPRNALGRRVDQRVEVLFGSVSTTCRQRRNYTPGAPPGGVKKFYALASDRCSQRRSSCGSDLQELSTFIVERLPWSRTLHSTLRLALRGRPLPRRSRSRRSRDPVGPARTRPAPREGRAVI